MYTLYLFYERATKNFSMIEPVLCIIKYRMRGFRAVGAPQKFVIAGLSEPQLPLAAESVVQCCGVLASELCCVSTVLIFLLMPQF